MAFQIYGYHTQRALRFFDKDGSTPSPKNGVLYIGAELETDSPEVRNWNTSELTTALSATGFFPLFLPTSDSSLHNGCEFVSYPLTLEAWMQRKELIHDAFKALTRAGLRAHETETCGLHIHVSRGVLSPDGIQNLINIVDGNWPQMTEFARRGTSGYAARNVDRSKNEMKDYVKRGVTWSSSSDRRKNVNLTNAATIEFRFFKGTLNPATFLATLQFVDNLCRLSRFILPVDSINMNIWDVINFRHYEELKGYSLSRKLDTNRESKWVDLGEEE